MTRDEIITLLRNRSALTSQPYSDDVATTWHEALGSWSYPQARSAMIRAAREEKRITIAHLVERLPPRRTPAADNQPDELCIRCQLLLPERGRIRCTSCQAILDDEMARGERNPAMMAAIAAAHRRKVSE